MFVATIQASAKAVFGHELRCGFIESKTIAMAIGRFPVCDAEVTEDQSVCGAVEQTLGVDLPWLDVAQAYAASLTPHLLEAFEEALLLQRPTWKGTRSV